VLTTKSTKDTKDLIKTLREAVKVVKSGKPALVDVVCQMR